MNIITLLSNRSLHITIRTPSKIKEVFQIGKSWLKYFEAHKTDIRDVELENMTNIMSCGLQVRGYQQFVCHTKGCHHTKKICFSCNCRSCPTCGKMAVDRWIENIKDTFPECKYQHITFTMPDVLWQVFKDNRDRLGELFKCACEPLLKTAKEKGITVGIFSALHTYGRQLNWNTHIHLSVSMGGLTKDGKWKNIRFSKKKIMPMWRYAVIKLIREIIDDGYDKISKDLTRIQYERPWVVHFDKPTEHFEHTITYIGRYIKKPPIAMSKIKEYDGNTIKFRFLNHRNNKHQDLELTMDEFIERFIQHIPEKGFRMIRYYGFLANAVRGKLLPKIYKLLGHKPKVKVDISYQQMSLLSFNVDPLKCILCGAQLLPSFRVIGKSTKQLMQFHTELASRKRIPV